MHSTLVASLAAFATLAAGLSTPHNYVSHEKRTSPLKKWKQLDDVHPEAILPMRFGLRQPLLDSGAGDDLMAEM